MVGVELGGIECFIVCGGCVGGLDFVDELGVNDECMFDWCF